MNPEAKVIHSSGHVELDIYIIPVRYVAIKGKAKCHTYCYCTMHSFLGFLGLNIFGLEFSSEDEFSLLCFY